MKVIVFQGLKSSLTFIVPIFIFFSVLSSSANAAMVGNEDDVLAQYVYTPSSDPVKQASTALNDAKEQNKYALIVLGAQWCHDSVGLAQRFSRHDMQEILETRYVTQFIDIGYLQDRRDVTNLLGYPNYFATPTVLVVDPETNTIVNMDTITVWQSADSVDLQIYQEQFSKWNKSSDQLVTQERSINPVLRAYEAEQAERLQQAYAALGPLLEASDKHSASEKVKNERDYFFKLWGEVKHFRTNIQAQIHEFRTEQMFVGKENKTAEPKAMNAQLKDAIEKVRLGTQSWEQ